MGDARNPRRDYAYNKAMTSACPAGEMKIGCQRWLQYHRHVVDGAIAHCMDMQRIADAEKRIMRCILLDNLRKGVIKLPVGKGTKFDGQCRAVYTALCSALERVLGKGNDDPPNAVDEYIKHVERVCEKKGRDEKFIKKNTSYQHLLQVANGPIHEDFFGVAFNSIIDDDSEDDAENPPAQPAAADGPSSSVQKRPALSHKQPVTVNGRAAHPTRHNHTTAAEGSSDRAQPVQQLGAANDEQDTVTAKAAEAKSPSRHRSASKGRSPKESPVSLSKKRSVANSEKSSKRSTSSGGPSEPGQLTAAEPKGIKTEFITLDDDEDEDHSNEAANPAAPTAAGDQATGQEQAMPVQAEPKSEAKKELPDEDAMHVVADGPSPPSDVDETDVRKLRASCDVLNRFIDDRGLRASLFPFLVRYMLENASSDDGASETAKLRRNAEAMKAYIELNGHQADFVAYAFDSSGW